MKKQSAPSAKAHLRSAFFSLRVLIGLFIVLAGVFLELAGLGAFSALAQSTAQAQQKNKIITNSKDPLVPNGFDCSKIHELGIDKQLNFRAGAIMIACGQAQGGGTSATSPASPVGALSQFIKKLFLPLTYGGTDVDLITGAETYPHVNQSTTFSWANPDDPDQIVVAYVDIRDLLATPPDAAGASVSTDGGLTFTRLTKANGQSPFTNAGGYPIVLYNRPIATWYTVWGDNGCGGMGGYKSTTPWDSDSWTHYCIHSGSYDKTSGWTDMNPSSPFYGRMYISGNDFTRGQNIFVRYSTDNGNTWTDERQITTSFIRNVQITGDLVTGDVYIAGMDENGGNGCSSGCGTNRSNKIYRSTDGGNTWANTYTGPAFVGPCRGSVGYFCTMYSSPAYWRHMGWGEPAAYNGVVHYVYAARNPSNGDPGNVFYIRSTDSGVTFGAPFQLNSDTDPFKAQWEPSLSVSPSGTLFAVWYDERDGGGASTCIIGSNSPCYRMYARRSNDNGVTWLPDDAFSDVISPLPAQPEPGIVSYYVSDYDYASALATKHLASWVDGRVPINGTYQQDAFTDRELVGFTALTVVSTVPACGSLVTGTAPTDFTVNVSDPVDPTTLQASDCVVNGIPADSYTYTPGTTTITFAFNTTPVAQGPNTIHIPAGAFNRASDGQPNLEFTCTFCYALAQLMVTSTNPPVGGTFTGPGTSTYDVNWNLPVDPASVHMSDLQLSGLHATVTNVQVINGNLTTRFTINFTDIFPGMLTATIPAAVITNSSCNRNVAFTGNYNYVGSGCDSGIIQNGGFETGSFPPWVIQDTNPTPQVTNQQHHSGTYSAVVGGATGATPCGPGIEPTGDSSFYQQFAVPAGGGTLSFWHWDCTTDSIAYDWQDAYITDSNGTILQTIFHVCDGSNGWVNTEVDMSPYAGQTVRIKFLVHQDGHGDLTAMYVDDVALSVPCGTPSPTPTGTPTPTSTPRVTPTPRPAPTTRPRPTPAPRP